MATKSGQQEPEKAEVIEELLDALDSALDRVKVLYEQYFLGIQKQPPSYLHTDVERKIRDLTQVQVRNTALRYRFVTIQQKFGSYNAYWRRTLRQIENGTYTRNLVKISRQAARTGAEVPEEILAAMPKRMREQVKRDREAALAVARLREQPQAATEDDLLTLAEEDVDLSDLGLSDLGAAMVSEPAAVVRDVRAANGALQIDESDGDFDLDAFFSKVVNEDAPDPAPEQVPLKWGASDRPARAVPSGLTGAAARAQHPRPASGPTPAPQTRPSPATKQAVPTARARNDSEDSITRPMPKPELHDGPPSVPLHAGAPKRAQTPIGGVPQVPPPGSVTGAIPARTGAIPSVPRTGAIPSVARTGAIPSVPARPGPPRLGTQPAAIIPPSVVAAAASRPGMIATGPIAPIPAPTPSSGVPTAVMPPLPSPQRPPLPPPPKGSTLAPSQAARPSPIAPGSSTSMPVLAVETMTGPFPRIPTPAARDHAHDRPTVASSPLPRPGTAPVTPAPARPAAPPPRPGMRPPLPVDRAPPPPRSSLPAGVSDADVNALYTKYVQAKQTLGEQAGPNAYDKLLKTIHSQAPKIMEQYKAKGVDFSVVVKDNQVVIRAKPKP